MKNIVLNIGIIIFTFMIVVGILYFLNGSLEMVPTEELTSILNLTFSPETTAPNGLLY